MAIAFRISLFFVNAPYGWKHTQFLNTFLYFIYYAKHNRYVQFIVCKHVHCTTLISSSPTLTLECRPRKVTAVYFSIELEGGDAFQVKVRL